MAQLVVELQEAHAALSDLSQIEHAKEAVESDCARLRTDLEEARVLIHKLTLIANRRTAAEQEVCH